MVVIPIILSIDIFFGDGGTVSSSSTAILLGPSEKSACRSMDVSSPHGECSPSI